MYLTTNDARKILNTAQALLGKTVATIGGAMYSQHRCINAEQCLLLPAGTTPAQRAGRSPPAVAALADYGWQQHCHGLFQTPVAA